MTVSSRTPEGAPHRCPACGDVAALEPSYPCGDSCCPSCGELRWRFRDHWDRLGFDAREYITLSTSMTGDLCADSLDIVEVVMELEEAFDLTIPETERSRIQSVADAIRRIRRHRRT